MIGSLTAIGNIVYAAEFDGTSTTGFAMKSGRTVFRYPRGTYTPVVSDGRRLYLVGYSSISALQPFKYEAAMPREAARGAEGEAAARAPRRAQAPPLEQKRRARRDAARRERRRRRVPGAKAGKRREWIIRSSTPMLAG